MTIKYILDRLRKEDLSVIDDCARVTMVSCGHYMLEAEHLSKEDLEEFKCLIEVCNILYNNTDMDPLPIEDGFYDILLEHYKKFDKNFKVGAEVIHFTPTASSSTDHPIEKEPIEVIRIIPKEEIEKMNDMIFKEEIIGVEDRFKNIRSITVDANAKSTSKKLRTVPHNNLELVGTLDKCKFVLNKQAIDAGVFNDKNVKILERDFFEPQFKQGIINNNTIFRMVAEFKYDGVSVVVIIKNSIVTAAYSRGDTGMDKATDLTPVLYGYRFSNLPKEAELELKCEAIMTYTALHEFNRVRGVNYKNCRTAIIGLFGTNDAPMYRNFITLVPLKIACEKENRIDRITEINFMNKYLYTGEPLRCAYLEGDYPTIMFKIDKFVKEAEFYRKYMTCMYDGVVLSYFDFDMIDTLGRENFVNKYSVAIKFNALERTTVFRSIDYSIGQDGTIVPRVHYDPVEFLGTIHTKTSIGSLDRFNHLNLGVGDIITIVYINDVIPYLKNVVERSNSERINFPTVCPSCGSQILISKSGSSAKCTNIKCTERNVKRLANMMDKLGMKNIGEETIRSINIFSFTKLLHISKEDIIHIGDASSTNFIECMKLLSSEIRPDYEMVGSLGFTGIAKSTWKAILHHYTIAELLSIVDENGPNGLLDKLSAIKGIGKATEETIINEFDFFYADLVEISLMNNIVGTKGLKPIKVRFTGVRDEELCNYLNKNGYDAGEGSVTKDTDYLVVPSIAYTSSKIERAKSIESIKIVAIEDFRKLVDFVK